MSQDFSDPLFVLLSSLLLNNIGVTSAETPLFLLLHFGLRDPGTAFPDKLGCPWNP